MFSTLLTAGAIVGALIGSVHAIGVYRAARHGAARPRLTAGYSALWTLVLWTLFGPYVLLLWMLSLPLWLGRRAAKAA